MLQLSTAHARSAILPAPATSHRRKVRAVRPALIDLRFKGDAWVVDQQNGTVSVCLGDYQLLQVLVTPFDVPALNRALAQVRLGQARRQYERRRCVVGE
jgi:hypothetical protein